MIGLLLILTSLYMRETGLAQVPVTIPTEEDIAAAIQLAADDQRARRFLEAYVLQSRAGWGSGPLLGVFNTPYSRIVQAARSARAQQTTFVAADVTPDMLAPEIHVIVPVDVPAAGEEARTHVRGIVITPRSGVGSAQRIEPLRLTELTKEYRARYGVAIPGPARVAEFPISAMTAANQIVISVDQIARGSTAAADCRDCAVAFRIPTQR
jgi:hypothetical protein